MNKIMIAIEEQISKEIRDLFTKHNLPLVCAWEIVRYVETRLSEFYKAVANDPHRDERLKHFILALAHDVASRCDHKVSDELFKIISSIEL